MIRILQFDYYKIKTFYAFKFSLTLQNYIFSKFLDECKKFSKFFQGKMIRNMLLRNYINNKHIFENYSDCKL